MMDLKKKVIVITGASQGLGKALAEKVAMKGAKTILIARSKKKLAEITEKLFKKGYYARYIVCDIRDSKQVQKAVKNILETEKTIDILVNNAGIWTDNQTEETHPEKRQDTFNTNALGNIQFAEEVLKYFKEKNAGYIFNVISTSGIVGTPASDNAFWKTYGATKWAMTGYTNALRSELAKTHIKVTGFSPGGIDTNLYENAGIANAHNQAWMMKTEDVVDIILFSLTRPADVLLEKIVVTKVF